MTRLLCSWLEGAEVAPHGEQARGLFWGQAQLSEAHLDDDAVVEVGDGDGALR